MNGSVPSPDTMSRRNHSRSRSMSRSRSKSRSPPFRERRRDEGRNQWRRSRSRSRSRSPIGSQRMSSNGSSRDPYRNRSRSRSRDTLRESSKGRQNERVYRSRSRSRDRSKLEDRRSPVRSKDDDEWQRLFGSKSLSTQGRGLPEETRRESFHVRKDFAEGGPPEDLPALYSVHQGSVVSVREFGAFVKLDGFTKHGMVHISQISNHHISAEDIAKVVAVKDRVWVKVIKAELGPTGEMKVSLSMKLVNQTTGKDLDPNNTILASSGQKGGAHPVGHRNTKIELGAVLDTVCSRCGAKGHFASECFYTKGQEKLELVSDDEGERKNASSVGDKYSAEDLKKALEKIKKKEKKKHKDKKHDKKKKDKKRKHRHSSSSSESDSASSTSRHKHKKRKHKHD